MSSDNTIKYYTDVYKAIADIYVIEKLSLPAACAKVGVKLQTYYKICKKLNVPSVTTYKNARLNFISNANNIDEHNCAN